MRSSTILALLVTTVIGLAGVSSFRLLNRFRSPAAPGTEEPTVKVLVANQNILKGNLIEPRQVMVRTLKPTERSEYLRFTDHYLPPIESAVYLRIAGENILADTPIRTDQLEPFENPEGIPERLAPHMRPVSLSVQLEDSTGGLLRVGDWVNVYFSTVITGPGLKDSPQRVLLVPNARIILKRNTLRPIYSALPADKPVPFTIETNEYRAAVCDFARDQGEFSLVAIPESEAKELESARNQAMEAAQQDEPVSPEHHRVSFIDPSSAAYKKEQQIVENFVTSGEPIRDRNLQEIFNLAPQAIEPAPAPKITRIEQYHGTRRQDDMVFSSERRLTNMASNRKASRESRADLEGNPANLNPATSSKDPSLDSSGTEFQFRKPTPPTISKQPGLRPAAAAVRTGSDH